MLTFIRYVDRSTAETKDYIRYKDGDAIFGVDYKSKLNSADGGDIGRESVRLEGKKDYNKGLFVLDIKHMPGGVCGTWPAFWSLGREPWPVKGEIDIIEGVNQNSVNNFVLHTDTNCKVNGLGQTGTQALKDCALDSSSGSTGCGVTDARTNSFGAGFNAANGGYYVTEWQAEGIKIWFFPRGSEPRSLTSSEPDTSEFGLPAASFQGHCDIEKRFMDQRFIFSNTFCGDWAGSVYAHSGCPMYDGLSGMASCKKYVAEHPEAFKDAYWRVSSFKTYNKRTITSSSSVAPSSTPHASSSSIHVSSSSAHVSSSSVAHSSSVLSSSIVDSSATPTPHVSSSIYPSSTPAASSSYPHDVSSSVMHDYSSTVSVSASETPYDHASSSSIAHDYSSDISSSASETPSDHDSSSVLTPSASETPYSHDVSSTISSASVSETPYSHDSFSIDPSASPSDAFSSGVSSAYPSETPYGSSSIVHPSETPYDSSAIYSTGTSSAAYPDVTSYPVDGQSFSSTPVYSTSAPVYSVYPEGDGYEYGSSSSETPDASSKASEYPTASSKIPDYDNEYPVASSKIPEYDTYPTVSTKTPGYDSYPVAASSAPVHGNDYSSYPISSSVPAYSNYPASAPSIKSTPVYADYPELPSLTPLYSTHPAISSKPSYGDDEKSTDSYKTTTAYETTYVDVCSTGYTTITTKVTAIQTPAPYPTTNAYYAPPGFEVTTKYCAQGCGEGPKTVTVTVPCSKCQVSTPVPNKPASSAPGVPSNPTDVPNEPSGNTPYTPAQPNKPSGPEDSTTKIAVSKIVTLTKVPALESQHYATHPSVVSPSASLIKYPVAESGESHGNSKPVAPTVPADVGSDEPYPTGSAGGNKPVYPTGSIPASKPLAPTGSVGSAKPVYPSVVGYPGSNVTISYGTATSASKPTQTGYKIPEFTGAASSLQMGGVVAAAVAAFAALMV